jgi:hypothetical protein
MMRWNEMACNGNTQPGRDEGPVAKRWAVVGGSESRIRYSIRARGPVGFS